MKEAKSIEEVKVIVASFNTWHMDNAAKAYQNRNNLAGIYSSIENGKGIDKNLYHRCWPFHLLMKPFYILLDPLSWQQIQYNYFMNIFNTWLRIQQFPDFNVMQAIYWGAKCPFDLAEKHGAIKVLDVTNSYPTIYDGIERREMSIWAKKVKPSVPKHIIEQVVRDIERADVILCPSKFVYDSMINNGVPSEKCKINYFGVNTSIFQPRKFIPKVTRFICVGSLCLRKGHQYLFMAFAKLKKEYPSAELFCCGEVLNDFKKEWIKWKHLPTFQGMMSHNELAQLLQNSTAFIIASVEEGFARSILEAMASGLPILATYESGATTLIENRKEGIIFSSRNCDEIYNAMKEIIENPKEAEIMGNNSLRKGRVSNDWDDYGKRNIDIFNKYLSKKMQ
jgi:glycosyltransferase involved in cell wall biosynthesis